MRSPIGGWPWLSPRGFGEQAAAAGGAHQRLESSSLGSRGAPARISDAIVVPALVAGLGRGAPGALLDQAVLKHARERAIHRPHVRNGGLAPRLDVLDDPVSMALADREAE